MGDASICPFSMFASTRLVLAAFAHTNTSLSLFFLALSLSLFSRSLSLSFFLALSFSLSLSFLSLSVCLSLSLCLSLCLSLSLCISLSLSFSVSVSLNLTINRNQSSITFLDGTVLPRRSQALYLGATLRDSVDNHTEVIRRIGSVNAMASQLQLFWSKAGTTVKWRLRVFEATLSSKLLHGLETMQLTKSELNSIDAFQMKMLRKILTVPSTYIDRAWTNQRIYNRNLISTIRIPACQSLEQMETKQNSPVRAHSPCAPS